MPRLLTWRTLRGPPFFSSKRALRSPGVIKSRGYKVQRWVQEDGESVLAMSTPKCSEIGQISKQSRGQGGSDEKAAIRERTGRNFPIACVHFCHLSHYTENQAHMSKRMRHELTGTGRPAGTTQKNLTSGRHLAHW